MSQHVPAIFEDGVFKPLTPLNLAEHQHVWLTVAPDATPQPDGPDGESFFDAATQLGYVGCIKGTPSDLSTNKKYMEGFGKRGE
jgi:hypothetical protein